MPSWPDERAIRNVPFGWGALSNAENWWRQAGIAPLMTSGTWTAADLAVYTPILVPRPARVMSIACFNGAAVSGNKDIGIYLPDAEGKPGDALYRQTSTAQAGTTAFQAATPASEIWVQGLVYLAFVLDNTTGAVTRLVALTTNGSGLALGSIFTEAAAFPLPATATPDAAGVAANVPILELRTG